MSLFLSDNERGAFEAFCQSNEVGRNLFGELSRRVSKRAESPGLHGPESGLEWWFCAAGYLSDAAMLHALKKLPNVSIWLRDVTLSLVRRTESDWIGPAFRDHSLVPSQGNLETAHLTWGIAVVLDLAPDVFTASEIGEIRCVLTERGIPMCRRWIENHTHMTNWRCVLAAGVAVAAAALDKADEFAQAVTDFQLNAQCFQPDGSYGESLQYANYAAWALALAREALIRRRSDLEDNLPLLPWGQLPRWQTASLFYQKPLPGWGAALRPRSANFNDSAAIGRPSADLLLHIAVRGKATLPEEAKLARRLFDDLYSGDFSYDPYDGVTFGFLSVPLLPSAIEAGKSTCLPEVMSFSCGDVIARDAWDGKTILAVHGGGDSLRGAGHLHGDLNSFILVHRRERLLVDPGHSCYRNLIHGLEGSSRTHNTCTFQTDIENAAALEQSRAGRVRFDPNTLHLGPPHDRGARRLLAERSEDVTVIASDAAGLYGKPIEEFSRCWILCGSHVLFIVDRIAASMPVRTKWHWLFNNRDGELDLQITPPDQLIARRGAAGMKMLHLAGGRLATPEYAYVHDAYRSVPNGRGEGKPGSGLLLTWTEAKASQNRTAVHAIALDSRGKISDWRLKTCDRTTTLESPAHAARWGIEIAADSTKIEICESAGNRKWRLSCANEWNLQKFH